MQELRENNDISKHKVFQGTLLNESNVQVH